MRPKESEEPKPEKAEQKQESVEEKPQQSNDLEELRRQVPILEKEKDDLFARLQRLSADYANFQKRTPKQVADTIAYEKERIIRTLLPAMDNFEHSFQNARAAENVDAFVKGVRIIYDQIINILKSHGVEQINALGKKFDPSQHEAVRQEAQPQQPDGAVLEELQKGYKLNGRVIRASRVVVNMLPKEKPPERQEPAKQQPQDHGADTE
jgi:molecular chaperone GrpE